ncbi:hypothetical protein CC80DRAFT_592295 [Byssothecium circinans]|uniref:Serine-threonine/tyrosine-protein kinase catalytic domain-containing protein n=1 Tax=Byssothecium circinans TaxID=147558 RepID=A0A6A5U1I6_9PLEO|nr:hypothetical protein CC80DRAFT_592295 [Byssothecium circinans]
MPRSETIEFRLCQKTDDGTITTSDSLWRIYMSGLGRDDAEVILKEHGITNAWFPFPKLTLRQLLDSRPDELNFDEWQQDLHQSSSWPDTDPSGYIHLSLEDADEIMETNRHFGHGAFGYVRPLTMKTQSAPVVCIRKKVQRPKALKAQRQYFAALSREIHVMRQVSHSHCVQLLGSYTDYNFMGILLLPVADMDLAAFLDLPKLSDAFLVDILVTLVVDEMFLADFAWFIKLSFNLHVFCLCFDLFEAHRRQSWIALRKW